MAYINILNERENPSSCFENKLIKSLFGISAESFIFESKFEILAIGFEYMPERRMDYMFITIKHVERNAHNDWIYRDIITNPEPIIKFDMNIQKTDHYLDNIVLRCSQVVNIFPNVYVAIFDAKQNYKLKGDDFETNK